MVAFLLFAASVLALVALGGGGPPDDSSPAPAGSLPPELVPYTRTSSGWRNDPPPEVWADLERTRRLYLEWFQPIAVFTSAYRTVVVGGAVGSELGAGSAHVYGRALDLVERDGISRGMLRAQAMAAKVAGQIRAWVDEGDHVHVEW